ncbi:hypothetical protein KRR55_05790 [Paeniglutamicibacter sp. ABSL32-1]|nr:hypothetical protein [Paeniglutamicibacter quisquiliarum]MBV1778625.1 hypothetical protein [Paeniglutamicibacter quisquiliarum]
MAKTADPFGAGRGARETAPPAGTEAGFTRGTPARRRNAAQTKAKV